MIDTMMIDLHMHTIISDGTESPERLLACVKDAGIDIFSVTDHDAIASGQIVPQLLRAGDPAFISGVEFSCKDESGKYHILGYGFDPKSSGILQIVEQGHQLRLKKLRARLSFLQKTYGFSFPEKELSLLYALDNPGKPHLGNLMVKLGYVQSRAQAIRDYINKAITPERSYLRPEEAIQGILAAGGIPVLAHPCYGSGDQLILGNDLQQRVLRLSELGLKGLEVYYSGIPLSYRDQVLALAEQNALYVTAGSDYHGANKQIRLGDTGLQPGQQLPDGLIRFLQDVHICRAELNRRFQ